MPNFTSSGVATFGIIDLGSPVIHFFEGAEIADAILAPFCYNELADVIFVFVPVVFQGGKMSGIFAVVGDPEAARLTYFGLYAEQGRGEEGAGICSSDGQRFYDKIGRGYAKKIFDEQTLDLLKGDRAIGHVSSSLDGDATLRQPVTFQESRWGPIALVLDGRLVESEGTRQKLIGDGVNFKSKNDAELILHLLSWTGEPSLEDSLRYVLSRLQGGFSLVVQTLKTTYVARDPRGFRPLGYGRRGEAFVIGSETCAFDLIDADYHRDINRGEILRIAEGKAESFSLSHAGKPSHCLLEHLFYSRPDSRVFERGVYSSRHRMGELLARKKQVPADCVVPIPDSGLLAAIGYSLQSGIRMELALIRNHYIGPSLGKATARDLSLKIKLNPIKDLLRGKRVILVDDVIRTGSTCKGVVALVRTAEAREVHLRLTAPPLAGPCPYGVDSPGQEEFVGPDKSSEEICKFIGADTLGYLEVEETMASINGDTSPAGIQAVIERDSFCTDCFSGVYHSGRFVDLKF